MRCRNFEFWGFRWFVVAALVGAMSMPAAAEPKADSSTSYVRSLSKAFQDVAKKVHPAVVLIKSRPAVEEAAAADEAPGDSFEDHPFGDMLPPEFRRFFKDMPRAPRGGFGFPRGMPASVGSGVIVDPSGVILTNHHVVQGGGKIVVRLFDGREFDAVEIKTDPKTDLAILRIKGAGPLTAAQFGDSDRMQVGDWVLALGGPFGLEGTVTAGIVSAKGRGLESETRASFIQTDAAINPGNSGGPLVNLDGEIVGINRAIASNTGGYQGVGFAISSNLAQWVCRQLIDHGSVRRGYLGVAIQPLEQNLAEKFGVRTHQGVVIAAVQPDTPAAEAGLKPGDVVLEFAGKSVDDPKELQQAVDQSAIGKKQNLTLLRDGKRMTLEVTPREQPADYGLAGGDFLKPGPSGTLRDEKLGLSVGNLTPDVAEKLGAKPGEGVVITEVREGSPARMAGLAAGMVIVQVDRKPVKSVDEFHAAMEKQSLAKGVLLLVQSGQGTRGVVSQSRSEPSDARSMLQDKKVVVVMPAYNAARTLRRTYDEVMAQGVVDLVIVVDDASRDDTAAVAQTLPNTVFHAHPKNMGYGANQKTCYRLAREAGADIVVMIHPDYQYTPRLIPAMASMIASGLYPCVLGSRILGGSAMRGGMPWWKYLANRFLTLSENFLLGAKLSEYHTGYRAFSGELLDRLDLSHCSDDFVFDNQMLAQILWTGATVAEVSCPTRYEPESSSINLRRSVVYGFGCLRTGVTGRLAAMGLVRSKLFPKALRKVMAIGQSS